MKNTLFVKQFTLLLVALIFAHFAWAQGNLNFYNSKSLVQTSLLNPAHQGRQTFTLGLIDANLNLAVPGITAYDILRNDENYTTTFGKILKDQQFNLNNINLGSQINVLMFGLRMNKTYASFGLQINNQQQFSIPKDFAALGYYGNTNELFGKEIRFDNLRVNTTSYAAVHAGLSHQFNNRLTIGIRGKYLIGLFDAQINRSNGYIKTDSGNLNVYKLTAKLDYELQAAGIDRIIYYQNMAPNATVNSFINPIYKDAVGRGFAFDLGIDYKINKKMSVSASILDIGGINWNQAKIYSKNFNFEFEGFTNPDFDSIAKITGQLVDSLQELARPLETNISYRRNLINKYYVGFNYQLTNSTAFDFVGYGEKQADKFNTGFSLNLSQRIWHILELRAGVTKFGEFKPAVGAGIAVHLGPLTIYGNTDQLFNNINYTTSNIISNRVGLNLNIGCLYDNDNDGVPNKRDKCKNVPGYKDLDGCSSVDTSLLSLSAEENRVVNKAIESIKFEKGTNKLDSNSFSKLEGLVKLLKTRTEATLQIDVNPTAGETKGIGEDISQDRANVLKTYFISKGIDANRILASGLGSNLKSDKKPELPKTYKKQVVVKLLKKI